MSALSEKYEELGPRGSSANFFVPPTTDPIQCPIALPLPPLACPITATPPAQPHSSQGCLAIDQEGHTCSVTYMYGVAQALALAAQSTKTPFDPRSLDLPSIRALVGFYHACLGFPAKQTWLDAIKAGNCDSFDGLTYSNAARYCPDADETILGHLAHSNARMSARPSPAPLLSTPPYFFQRLPPKNRSSCPTKSTSVSSPSASSTQTTPDVSPSRPGPATSM